MTSDNKPLCEKSKFTRNAAELYSIQLTEEPYLFSKEMLKRDTDIRVQRKRDWHYPKLEFVSFNDGTLKLNNIHEERSFELTIIIHPDELKVSCNCGTEVETLCFHAYKALERLTWFGSTFFFKDYQPGGMVEIAIKYSRYFNIRRFPTSLDVNPKPELNTVYQMSGNVNLSSLNRVLQMPASRQVVPAKMKDAVFTYIIVCHFRSKWPPFLLPCIGYLNKAGTYVKFFGNFISGAQKQYDEYLTEDQRTLNQLCYEMCQLAENLPGSFLEEPITEHGKMNALFELWEKAFSLLQYQPYVFKCYLYTKRELKGKPSKQHLDLIEIKTEKPLLQFYLSDRQDFFQLQLKAAVKNRVLEHFFTDHSFFIKDDREIYLLPSLRDAAIVEWMESCDNSITIFKEHFNQFERDFLNPLRENYSVEIVASSPFRITKTSKKSSRNK
jgi:hypothetical protein